MLKLIFGFLGLVVVLAIAASLARPHLGAAWPFSPVTTPGKAAIGVERAVASGRGAGDQTPVARRDGSATAVRARPPDAQPAPQGTQERSVFQRQDEALQQSVNRYKRADP